MRIVNNINIDLEANGKERIEPIYMHALRHTFATIGGSPEECYGYAGPIGGGNTKIFDKDESWWKERHDEFVKDILKVSEGRWEIEDWKNSKP